MSRSKFLLTILVCMLLTSTLYAKEKPYQLDSSVNGIKTPVATMITFDETIYNQAYDVFLANGNLRDAFLVAQAAVSQRPKNTLWRHRLAKVASWYNQPRVAMMQWYYLAQNSNDPKALQQAITRATQLNENRLLVELLQQKYQDHLGDKKLLEQLLLAQERLGTPEAAIATLKLAKGHIGEKFYLEQLAGIYQRQRQPQSTLEVIKQFRDRYGLSPNMALKKSELDYSRGRLQQAYQDLMDVKEPTKIANVNYWRTLGGLAWLLQEKKMALKAYSYLYQHKIATHEELRRLILLSRDQHPNKAFNYAQHAWQQTKQREFFVIMLDLGSEQKRWQQLANLFNSLSPHERKTFRRLPAYWMAQIQTWQHLEQTNKTQYAYQQALHRFPDNIDLRKDYLWFLYQYGGKKELALRIKQWRHILESTPELYDLHALAYIKLGNHAAALNIYLRQLPMRKNDPEWLMNFASALDSAKKIPQAKRVRRYAFFLISQGFATGQLAQNDVNVRHFTNLAMSNNNMPAARTGLQRLIHHYYEDENNSLLMAYALAQKNYPLAKHLQYFRKKLGQKTPAWAAFALALNSNDQRKLRYILLKDKQQLSLDDKIQAYKRLGETTIAEDLRLRALARGELQPSDFSPRSTLSNGKAELTLRTEWHRRGGLEISQQQLTYRQPLKYNLEIEPYLSISSLHNLDTAQLRLPFGRDRRGGIILRQKTAKRQIALQLGQRHSLGSFSTGSMDYQQQVSRKFSYQLKLGYNQLAEESSVLLLGAVKHNAVALIDYNFTGRDRLHMEWASQAFQSQDGEFIGHGHVSNIQYEHIFNLKRKKLGVGIFYYNHRYFNAAPTTGVITRLLPQTQTFVALPSGYLQYGLNISYNTASMSQKSPYLQPFLYISTFRNSISGFGYFIYTGFSKRFARAHTFRVYMQSAKNQLDASQVFRTFGISYQYDL